MGEVESGLAGGDADRPTGSEEKMKDAVDSDPEESVDAEAVEGSKEVNNHTASVVAASGAVFIMIAIIMIIVYTRVRRR